MTKLRILDLFSGIGGFSLGLERATLEVAEIDGFETVAFCEIEEFPRKVLAKHWPAVPCYTDVRELTGERLAADGIAVDLICGGFPCQDISFAGLGAGLAGERSGLFYEVARLIGELGPRFVILENVGALLSRGLDAVLGTLASLGYDAEWHCIPASAVGAPHRRDRVWIMAYPAQVVCERGRITWERWARSANCGEAVAHSAQLQRDGGKLYREHSEGEVSELGAGGGEEPLADANHLHEQGQQPCVSHPQEWQRQIIGSLGSCRDGGGWWRVEPGMGRVANGVPNRSHRLKALGNAVVPQIPELIGNAILQSLHQGQAA